jgi:polyisoprenoid-binding protein YceI
VPGARSGAGATAPHAYPSVELAWIGSSLEFDDEGRWQMVLTRDASGLDAGNPRRDKHLRSAAFFDVEHYPVVRFRSRGVTERGGRLAVATELEAAGEHVALEVELTVADSRDERLELVAVATVDQRRLG